MMLLMEVTVSNSLTGKEILGTDFKIVIDNEVYRKVMYWVDKSEHEVSGFGSIKWDKEAKVFRVTDAILLDQDNSPTSSEICPHAIGKAMFQMKDDEGALKWWWHSHVNMNVFWSGDDMNCIRGLGQQGWMTATVFNKKREFRSAFYQLTDVMDNKHEVFVDEIDTSVDYPMDESKIAEWDESYKKHVTEKKYSAPKTTHYDKTTHYGYRTQGFDDQMDLYGCIYPPYRGYAADDVVETPAALDPMNTFGLTNQWDDEGWRLHPKSGDYQYSPVRRKELSEENMWAEIEALDKKDFVELLEDDNLFREFVYEEIAGYLTK